MRNCNLLGLVLILTMALGSLSPASAQQAAEPVTVTLFTADVAVAWFERANTMKTK